MTRTIFGLAFALVVLGTFGSALAQGVYHQGYTKRDGAYVAPHYQSAPNNSYNDNYGVRGNTNPYTGQQGTRAPTWNDKPPEPAFGAQPQRSRNPNGYR